MSCVFTMLQSLKDGEFFKTLPDFMMFYGSEYPDSKVNSYLKSFRFKCNRMVTIILKPVQRELVINDKPTRSLLGEIHFLWLIFGNVGRI